MEDHYTLLGISRTASKEEIDAAWRRAVKIWHPDRNRSNEANVRLQAINTARNDLMDDTTRRRYDRQHGFNRPDAESLRMKRPVRTVDPGDAAQGTGSANQTHRKTGNGKSDAEKPTPSTAPANRDWWARFADVARRNAEAVKSEMIRTAAEKDRADSTTVLERRPRFTRFVLMPAGIAAIVIAALLTLMLV